MKCLLVSFSSSSLLLLSSLFPTQPLEWALYFCLFILYLVVLGLRCHTPALSSCGAQASHCSGFSCCGARALGAWASVTAVPGLWSPGSVAVMHGLCCSVACGILLAQALNPCPLCWQVNSLWFFWRIIALQYCVGLGERFKREGT